MLNVKALVRAFNQEKALVGAFSVIVKTGYGTDGALHSTNPGVSEGPLLPDDPRLSGAVSAETWECSVLEPSYCKQCDEKEDSGGKILERTILE